MTTQVEPATKAVMQLVEDLQTSWNRHDAKAYSKYFADDAEFINVFGSVSSGRKAIEEGHALVFSKLFKNSSLSLVDTSVRFIRHDVASVLIRWNMRGATQPDGSAWKEREGMLAWIVVHQNQRWEIVIAHNSELREPLPGLATLLSKRT